MIGVVMLTVHDIGIAAINEALLAARDEWSGAVAAKNILTTKILEIGGLTAVMVALTAGGRGTPEVMPTGETGPMTHGT